MESFKTNRNLYLFKKPLTLKKAPLHKKEAKAPKSKDKKVKDKGRKPTHLKPKGTDKSRPMTIQDYGKLRKMLQTLSRWQRQPHQFRHSSNELHQKQMPSYKELRKILEDMTPAIVKNIASKIIAEDMNRTRLSDMKPLKAVHSLEANLAAARTKNDRDTGFKRVKVDSSKYKNWSDKINKTATKAGKKYEDVNLEADAKTVNSSEKGNGTEAPSRYATQTVLQVQTIDGSKIPKLPSFIPIADKKRKEGVKEHSQKTSTFPLAQRRECE